MPKLIRNRSTFIKLGEQSPNHHSSKNTKQWCRGKVGTPHDWQWVFYWDIPNTPSMTATRRTFETSKVVRAQVRVCATCHKQEGLWRNCRWVHVGCGTVVDLIRDDGECIDSYRFLYSDHQQHWCETCQRVIATKGVV